MSDNPFEQPVVPGVIPPQQAGPASIPTTVIVLSIICMILGVLGLFGTCAGGVGLAAVESLSQMMPAEVREDFEKQMSLQFVPAIIQILIGIIAAPLMVIGCIGSLTRKEWGRSLFVMAAIGFIVWNLVVLGTTIWMTIFHIDLMAAPNVPAMGEQTALQLAYGTQIVTMVITIAIICFYAFVATYMKRQHVKDFYASQTV